MTCQPCPASYFCSSGAPVLCPAGSACPLSSLSPVPCAAGTYSGAGAAACTPATPCPLGYFSHPGATTAATACYACPPGVYGAAPGLGSAACSGPCSAPPGYGCPAGSTSPANATLCLPGRFCPGGSPAPALSCAVPGSCNASGLAAEPACVWSVSTVAGSGATAFANGLGAAASFYNPAGVAVGLAGMLYVADNNNQRIRQVTAAGVVGTLAGSGSAAWADGTGAGASFWTPYGIASHPTTGDLYIGDSNNHRIRRVTTSGVTSTFAGSGTAAWADGTGSAASFNLPSGLVIDAAAGVVYVADCGNSRVRAISPQGVVTTLAGSFSGLLGLALDDAGSLLVSDITSSLIRRVTPAGVVSTLAGSGAASWVDSTGTAAAFSGPRYLTHAANGHLLVADYGNNRLRAVSPQGNVSTVAGGSVGGYLDGYGTAAKLSGPFGVATAPSGAIYLCEYGGSRIRALTCAPCPPGVDCSSGAPGGACAAGTYCPAGSASTTPLACPAGSICLPGASSPTPCPPGTYSAAIGGTSLGLCLTCPAGFHCPTATVPASASASGVAYVTGASAPIPCTAAPGYGCGAGSSSQWGVICPAGYVCYGGGGWGSGGVGGATTAWGGGSGGSGSGGSGGGGGPPMPCVVPSLCSTPGLTAVPPFTVATQSLALTLDSSLPGALAAAAVGLGGDGAGSSSGGGSLLSPEDVACDASGALAFVSTGSAGDAYHYVLAIALSGPLAGTVSLLAGSGAAGGADAASGPAASFNIPGGLTPHPNGTLYLVDVGGHKVRAISPSGAVTTVAGSGAAGYGNGAGASAAFSSPTALTLDAAGTALYCADTGNHRIRRIALTTGGAALVTTLVGTGTSGGQDGLLASASLSSPRGLALENATGALLIAEAGRVRRLSPNGTLLTTLAGNGSAVLADGLGAGAAFASPYRLSFSATGLLLVAEGSGSGSGGAIRAVSTVLGGVSTLGLGGLAGPHGVAAPPSGGLLLVADTAARVLRALVWTLASPTPTGTLTPSVSPSVSPSPSTTPSSSPGTAASGMPTATLSSGASPSTTPTTAAPPSGLGAPAPPSASSAPTPTTLGNQLAPPPSGPTEESSAMLILDMVLAGLLLLGCSAAGYCHWRSRSRRQGPLAGSLQGKSLEVGQQQQQQGMGARAVVVVNPLAAM